MTLSRSQRFALRSTGANRNTAAPFKLSPVSNVGSLESYVGSVVPVSTTKQTLSGVVARAATYRSSTGRVPSVEQIKGWVS